MPTAVEIVNQAIVQVADNQAPVTGVAPTFDDSKAGEIARVVYGPIVQFVARSFQWDFARRTIALSLSGNTPLSQWAYEYLYPTNGIQVWDIYPADEDINDPLPYDFNEANAVVGGTVQRVIQTNLQNALATYNNNPNESTWDSTFVQAVVKQLASVFAIGLTGKTDLMQAHLETYGIFEQIAESRQD